MDKISKIEAAKKDPKKLRVAAYARVSTGTAEQLVSLETQKNHYERYIRARPDWVYAGLYYDEGISGTSMANRDGLLRMLSDCDKGKIDYIIVKSISRLSRNTVDSLEIVRKLNEKGINIYFEKEKIDTGSMESELLLSILSGLAESESHSIASNEKWAIQQRFRDGTYKISYPPYGYVNVDGKMEVDPEQAKVVKRIFRGILDGKSMGTVAKEINMDGIPSKRGGKWKASTIACIVRNEKYTGDIVFQKTYTDDRFKRHRNDGEVTQYRINAHHEAIISHEMFEAANAAVSQNAADKGYVKEERKGLNRYVFSGKIVCGECGSKWKRIISAHVPRYICSRHVDDKHACSMQSICEDSIKAAFVTMMNKLTFAREQVLVPYERVIKAGGGKDSIRRLSEIEELLEDNESRRKQLTLFFTQGLLDPAIYAERNDELMRQNSALSDEKEALMDATIGSHERNESLEMLMRFTARKTMLTEFDESLFTGQVDSVIVYSREEIGFKLKCGPTFRERI
jgi:site-specific DNA recombinase